MNDLPQADVEQDRAGPTDTQIKTVSTLTERALLVRDILLPDACKIVEQLNDELKRLTEVDLPNALTDLKTAGFEYRSGNQAWDLKLETAVRAGITAENKPSAHAWLEDNGHGDLIKRKITIKFGRDQVKLAKKFIADMARRKVPLHPEISEEVNSQTLGAFVREQRREAEAANLDPDTAVPVTLFGIYKQRFVKFVEPKKKLVV